MANPAPPPMDDEEGHGELLGNEDVEAPPRPMTMAPGNIGPEVGMVQVRDYISDLVP